MRVLLVDDQALFREGLRTLLGTFAEIEVIGEAKNGEEALRLCPVLRPDVVLMDLQMPVMDGVVATRRLRELCPAVKVIALTTFDDDERVFDSLHAGAVGYLLKDVSSARLREAIAAAIRGESFLEPAVAAKVIAELARLRDVHERGSTADLGLSEREVEVLRRLARGASNKEIAAALAIAEGTVKNHLTSAFGKLGVSDRTQAALKARALGLG
jgi:DNA-binding NarL/FixJ family response regulator